MKKSTLVLTLVFVTGLSATAQLKNKYTAGLGFSTDLEKYGPNLKFDYHLTEKFGVGMRAQFLTGTWQDFSNPLVDIYAPYIVSVDYTKGNQMAVSIDAIYHIVGNSQDAKFGMRIDAGIAYHGWSQTSHARTNAPENNPAFYSYDKKLGSKSLAFKVGPGFEIKSGPGKIFLELPIYAEVYATEFSIYSNQTRNMGSRSDNEKETKYRLGDMPDTFIKLNIGYQIPLSSKSKLESSLECPKVF